VQGRRGSNNKADRVDQYGAVRGGEGPGLEGRGQAGRLSLLDGGLHEYMVFTV
jgi:hypothetical protein